MWIVLDEKAIEDWLNGYVSYTEVRETEHGIEVKV